MRALLLLLIFTLSAPAAPPPAPAFPRDQVSVEAARALRLRAGRAASTLETDAEKKDWAAARLAWIALARLQAKEAEALAVFRGCETVCGKFGEVGEWQAAEAWGCAKDPQAVPCRKK